MQNGALVVDVRTPGEFAGGHIEDAVNIPYDVIGREIGSYAPDKDRAIILYCRSGPRAAVAKKSLIRAGYTQVINATSLRKMRKILASK
ncbi:MAG: rhodanese-like domain-containing protein [Kiritimatiellales bacterium]|nr:rhodanese-like domain-containing protein [Kiritimatiellales bacterium]